MTMIAVMSDRRSGPAREPDDVVVRPEEDAIDFDSLFSDLAPPLYRALYAYTGRDRTIAEEATAEAFARAIAHQHSIRDPRAWLYRTAFRIAAAGLRDPARHHLELPEIPIDPPEVIGVAAALQQLSEHQRAAVVLCHVADLSTREAAAVLGVSAATIRVHLFRARARLRVLLSEDEEA